MALKSQIPQVIELLKADMQSLCPEHRAALEKARIAPREILVTDDPGAFVIAVANMNGKLLYWSEIEEGWELEPLNEAGEIPFRGTNQYELFHVLNQALGTPSAA